MGRRRLRRRTHRSAGRARAARAARAVCEKNLTNELEATTPWPVKPGLSIALALVGSCQNKLSTSTSTRMSLWMPMEHEVQGYENPNPLGQGTGNLVYSGRMTVLPHSCHSQTVRIMNREENSVGAQYETTMTILVLEIVYRVLHMEESWKKMPHHSPRGKRSSEMKHPRATTGARWFHAFTPGGRHRLSPFIATRGSASCRPLPRIVRVGRRGRKGGGEGVSSRRRAVRPRVREQTHFRGWHG